MPEGDVIVVEVTPSFDTPVRYLGRTFIRIGPRRDIATPLPRLESFITDAIITERPVTISLFREKNEYNYPSEALRELMMNAVMHRDYQSNMPTRLYQYDNRIEVMNPGGLYGKARPENFPNVNDYRNPVVAEAMKLLRYVNMFNHGVHNVQLLLKANGSKKAIFDVSLLTVFKVDVEDANVTDKQKEVNLEEITHQVTNQVTHQVKNLILTMSNEFNSLNEVI